MKAPKLSLINLSTIGSINNSQVRRREMSPVSYTPNASILNTSHIYQPYLGAPKTKKNSDYLDNSYLDKSHQSIDDLADRSGLLGDGNLQVDTSQDQLYHQ